MCPAPSQFETHFTVSVSPPSDWKELSIHIDSNMVQRNYIEELLHRIMGNSRNKRIKVLGLETIQRMTRYHMTDDHGVVSVIDAMKWYITKPAPDTSPIKTLPTNH